VSVKFFGQFLLERGVIGRQVLLDALKLQDDRNLRLGAYAVRRGYLTEAQAEAVNKSQLTEDKRFGELAAEMGLLTEEQVEELLVLQHNDYLLLGEALYEMGALDRPVLERELRAFKEDQARYLVDDVIFPPGTKEASLLAVPVDLTAKMLSRLVGITCKIGEGEREQRRPVDRLLSVSVQFSGGLDAAYTLSVSHDIAADIARHVLGDESGLDDEAVVDSVRELCNVICGNTAAKLAQAGRKVEIGPPFEGCPVLETGQQYVLFPLHVAEGAVEVRIRR